MKKSCSVLVALIIGVGTSAFAADIRGMVSSAQGQSVAGVQVIAKGANGAVAGQATTGSDGGYLITGLQSGNYNFTLEPGPSGFQGQTVASYVGPDGLCLNWGVSTSAPAVATAQPGATCQLAAAGGFGTAEMTAAGAALLGGGAIGAAAALSGSDNHHVATPSR
ncbi:MAG TPA: carboxypeptidase-like regulatory domain-containing protein [Candidatus Binataceae bacterium]|jgi:hypothetical protein|nr:carboxypeptidase-like regulatory domain-containing protein [Candidatus Binataceae bacterium]